MSNLDRTQLSKGDRSEVFLKKFFHLTGYMNRYKVADSSTQPGGQFEPTAIVFAKDAAGKDQEIAFEPDEADRYKEAVVWMNDMKAGDYSLFLVGKFVDDNRIETIKLRDLEKTEEFGGQVGGKRINLGIKFEKDFYESLDCYLNCQCKPTPYEKEAKELLEKIGIPGGLVNVEAVGGRNTPRPLAGNANKVYVGKGEENIGATITDITTIWRRNEKVYLSLKHGNTLTFINAGVGKIFTPNDYQNFFGGKEFKSKGYTYTNVIGKGIFKMFGIDPKEYARVFEGYGKGYKGQKVDTTSDADIPMIKSMLRYAIGYGYWMVHGGVGKVQMYEVDETYMKRAASIGNKVEVHYGGAQGKGKRVDIHMESPEYKFMWNIRNKQGGTSPTHLMCDSKKINKDTVSSNNEVFPSIYNRSTPHLPSR